MNDITDEMIRKGAAAIADLLTMLGVDPGERIEHNDAPSVAVQLAELVLQAGLHGCAVVDLPEPESQRERLTGVMHVWPIGGWSVTASPDGVGISTSRDGLGGGLGFKDGQASEIGAALIAADRRLAAKQSTDAAGGVL